MIAHSAKETGQQKEQWEEGDGWTKFEKDGGRQYRVGLHKIGGLAPLCQLFKKIFKSPHPPIIKPTPHSWLPPFLVKIFDPLHYSHFSKISSPLYERGVRTV